MVVLRFYEKGTAAGQKNRLGGLFLVLFSERLYMYL